MLFGRCCATAVAIIAWATPAAAQRFAFERSLDTPAAVTLDASTNRGKITISTGAAGRVIVKGTVTVRTAFDTPLNAVEIARRLASHPPIEQQADRVQVRPPADDTDRRAVTIAYEITVPADTHVIATSDSGALAISGVRGPITARTQSGALALARLAGPTEIATGSGAVDIDGADGNVNVTTSSSAITARAVRADLHVKTGSGEVSAESRGSGDIDISTASSAITVVGATGGLRIDTHSGSIDVAGRPSAPWTLSTNSSAIHMTLDRGTNGDLDAFTRSGSIRVTDLAINGTQLKQRVQGTIGTGGPTVKVTSGSGSFDIRGR